MKKAISTWGKAGKDSTVEFQKTLNAIKSAPSIAEATSLAIDAFGAKAGPDLADAIQGGRFEVEEYIKALEDAGGAVNSTYGMIVDDVDDAALATQTAQVALHDIGETIAKTLGPILLELSKKVKTVCDWFTSLDSGTQNAILGIIALIAAIGPIAGIISGISGALSLLMANPVVLPIAAIVAAVVGLKYLWDNCEEFREFWFNLWDSISSFFTTCWDGIMSFFTETIPNAWNSLVDFFKGIPAWWSSLWKGVSDTFKRIWDGLVGIVKKPINMIIAMINGIIDGINWMIGGINKIHVDIPDWVPGLGGKGLGFNLPEIGKIAYLAKGGNLLSGTAVVGEAGPELLTVSGGRAVVQPLTGKQTANPSTTFGGGVTVVIDTFVNNDTDADITRLANTVMDKIETATHRRAATFA